ncbi:mogroside IE synthase-like [Telopea speciosissima]|uniref:mogroside IE synthase-like n=1 Tax=Telopea speciosissima TaxID=54955 RepID=UPI001CC67541|nr:mogroside IE synthase-like [Telopea speciosissima]
MEKMKEEGAGDETHVLLFPFPAQGHINPMLQFCKRLASKGLKVTIAMTLFTIKSAHNEVSNNVRVEGISDGFDEGGIKEAESPGAYLERFEVVGSQSLAELIEKQESCGSPFRCLIYDSVLPWALEVAKRFGLVTASLFTQSCANDAIYYNVKKGLLSIPVEGPTVSLPGLPILGIHDLPSFIYNWGSYPTILDSVLNQFKNVEKADCLLLNTFDKLEDEVLKWMSKIYPIKTIGPTVPSIYLDKQVEDDKDYGMSLFESSKETCMDWLNMREARSVIYVSFGSMCELGEEQMEELALGLRNSNHYFLWVVRKSEENKLPKSLVDEDKYSEKGLVVAWCSQLEVLAHKAVGCFMTHCGWNSTIEAVSLGVPMIAMPQWTDQTMNAKFVVDVWEVGVRVKLDEKGIVRREEIEKCVKEVMDQGDRGEMIKRNAFRWKVLAKEAVDEGGSSDKNIEEFIASLLCA